MRLFIKYISKNFWTTNARARVYVRMYAYQGVRNVSFSENFTNVLNEWFLDDHTVLNPLSANFTKWSNTLKQFVGNLPTNCLSVFDHFVGLAFQGLTYFVPIFPIIWIFFRYSVGSSIKGAFWGNSFSYYILLYDQISLFDCLFILRYWAICVS